MYGVIYRTERLSKKVALIFPLEFLFFCNVDFLSLLAFVSEDGIKFTNL